MMQDFHHWLNHHLHYVLAGVANGTAWGQALVTGDFSVGAVVTAITLIGTALVGAIAGAIKTIGPVYLQFLENRETIRAKSMSGSMDRLSLALEDQTRQTEANKRLADTAAHQVERLQAILEMTEGRAAESDKKSAELTELVKTLTAKVDDSAARVEDANAKLNTLASAAQSATSRADLAESIAHELQAKLDEALAKLDANAKLVQSHVEVAEFGEKVARAAHELADTAKATGSSDDIAKPDGPPVTPRPGK